VSLFSCAWNSRVRQIWTERKHKSCFQSDTVEKKKRHVICRPWSVRIPTSQPANNIYIFALDSAFFSFNTTLWKVWQMYCNMSRLVRERFLLKLMLPFLDPNKENLSTDFSHVKKTPFILSRIRKWKMFTKDLKNPDNLYWRDLYLIRLVLLKRGYILDANETESVFETKLWNSFSIKHCECRVYVFVQFVSLSVTTTVTFSLCRTNK